jgi:hypothetical protein
MYVYNIGQANCIRCLDFVAFGEVQLFFIPKIDALIGMIPCDSKFFCGEIRGVERSKL